MNKRNTNIHFDIETKERPAYNESVSQKFIRSFLRSAKHSIATTFRWAWLYGKISYAQEGEDIILQKLFAHKKTGFYVDVGAHHPYRYSNTFWFYRRGWKGINIDATPGAMRAFEITRSRDTNLEVAISDRLKKLSYYLFEDGALNTLSHEAAEAVITSKQSKLMGKEKITTVPLKTILDRWLPRNKKIDFLSIDVEGADLQVLKSNNWKKYAPQVVVIEVLYSESVEKVNLNPVARFLKRKGYELIARTFNTAFFRKKQK